MCVDIYLRGFTARLDKPGETCTFGEDGWINDKYVHHGRNQKKRRSFADVSKPSGRSRVNVVTAIHEKTKRLLNGTL